MSTPTPAEHCHPGHATGPRTPEGKRRVSRNAITHGLTSRNVLLPEESRPNFEHFRNAMIADGQPVGGDEQNCVEQMIAAQWRLSRLWRQEGDVFHNARFRLNDPQADTGVCLLKDLQMEKGFAQLMRQEASLHRQYHRASRRLQELQALRRKGLRHVIEEDGAGIPAATQVAAPAQPSASSHGASTEITKQTPPGSAPASGIPQPAHPPAPVAAEQMAAEPAATVPKDSPDTGSGEIAKQTPGAGQRAAA